ncbi:hypothetical protein BGZ51_000288 [Haplosporangium sp. Z 767]|nr:hypothetical protein BGZ51_000288 [Haplosporangium sp. Z 767]
MDATFDIPEILSLVFKFLDRPSLIACSQVSHFWRSCSMPLIWTVYSVPSRFVEEYFKTDLYNIMASSGSVEDSSGSSSSSDTGINEQQDSNVDLLSLRLHRRIDLTMFYRNCSRIRSLTIGDDPAMLHELAQNRNDSNGTNTNHIGNNGNNGGSSNNDSSSNNNSNNNSNDNSIDTNIDINIDNDHIYMRSLATMAKTWPFSKIQNLIHLKFQGNLQMQFPKALMPILSNNPALQDLELLLTDASYVFTFILLRLMPTYPLLHLKKLSVTAKFDPATLLRFLVLLLLREKIFETKNLSPEGCSQIQELFIRDTWCQGSSSTPCTLDGLYIRSVLPGSFPSVRSLSLLNFNLPRVEEDEEEAEEGEGEGDGENQSQGTQSRPDPVVEIMRRFPHLERLRIGYDLEIVSKPSPVPFNARVAEAFPILEESSYMDPSQSDLIKTMVSVCPNLTAIDLGGNTNFDSQQFIQILDFYGRQLESLSVWGTRAFISEAFIKVIPPPRAWQIKFPGHAVFKGLTELDVSGCTDLRFSAWMVFKHMPTLKHFRALDVPLEAQFLIGFDWVCKDLETLAIQVLVPRQPQEAENPWGWVGSTEEWIPKDDSAYIVDNDYQSYEEKGEEEEEEEEGGYQEKFNGKKRKEQSSSRKEMKSKKVKKEHKTKKKKNKDDKEDKEGKKKKKKKKKERAKNKSRQQYKADTDSRTSDSEADTDVETEEPTDKCSAGPSTPSLRYSAKVQIQLCQQLGQLSKLRDLTLEGRQDYHYMWREWDCLHLTLATGLDRLEPLKSSLERLVVYQLEEELLGRREVEWIAKHWVHHQNPYWRPIDSSAANTADAESLSSMDHTGDQNYFRPSPKFKELIGVSVRGSASYASVLEMNLNFAWLQEQCPQLVIEKDDRRNDDDFSYGQFQEY